MLNRLLARVRGRGGASRFPAPVLLHIGIPKSATTALQNGLAGSRETLAAAGILYPDLDGRINHHQLAMQLLGRRHAAWNPTGDSHELLERLIEEASQDTVTRVVISSEILAEGDVHDAERVVHQLGKNVEVLITLRSIPQLLPSSWQQGASAGHQEPFEDWLHEVLRDPERLDLRPLLSLRGDDGHNLITRWSSVVGADRVTILIPDPTDRTSVFTEAEQLLGIAPGTLPQFASNTSLSFTQSELTRLTGEATKDRLTSFMRVQLIQQGMGNGMKRGSGERGTPAALPLWAVDASQRAARTLAVAIRDAGVRVIGDLSDLERTGATSADERYLAPTAFPLSMVSDALGGVFERARQEPFDTDEPGRPVRRATPLEPPAAPASGLVVVATFDERGEAGIGGAIAAASGRLAKASVGAPGTPANATLQVVPLLSSTGEDAIPGGTLVIVAESAGVTLRRLYQEHLVSGGTDSWLDFASRVAPDAFGDESAWERAEAALVSQMTTADAVETAWIDSTESVAATSARVEQLLSCPQGALHDPAAVDPRAALLTAPQLALLRSFNARTWSPSRGVHYTRLVRNGLVPSLLADGDGSAAAVTVPAAAEIAVATADARVLAILNRVGAPAPAARPNVETQDPDIITAVSTADAVAAAQGVILAARAAAKRHERRSAN